MKQKETKYVNMFIEDGILHFYYKEIDSIDLDIAKACVADRLEFSENISYPCLLDSVKTNNVTKEARDYFAKEGNELITANAMIFKSSIFRMIVNFFIIVNKPKNPTKGFTNRAEAITWLNGFKSDNNATSSSSSDTTKA